MRKQTESKPATVYGYARISTSKQSIERQIRNLRTAYPEIVIRSEAYTGTTLARPVFEALLKSVKPGDKLVFDSVSRMSRDSAEGFALYEKLFDMGVELEFIKEPHINTSVYKQSLETYIPTTGGAVDLILDGIRAYIKELARQQIKIAFDQAQKEIDDLHQRTREGIETVKRANAQAIAEGRSEDVKQIGKSIGDTWETGKAKTAKAIILKHSRDFGGSLSDADVITLAHVSRNSFYKYKSELKSAEVR